MKKKNKILYNKNIILNKCIHCLIHCQKRHMESKGFFMPIARVVVVSGHSSCMFTDYEDVPALPIPHGINVITLCSLNDELLTATNAPFRGLENLMSNPGVTVTLGGVVDLFKEKRKLRIINPATETSFERSIGVAYSGEQGTPQFFFGGRPNVQLANEGIFCWDSSSGGGMTDISLDLLTENQGLSLLTPLQMEFMKLERMGVITEPFDLRGSAMKFREEKKKRSGVDVGVENIKMFLDEYKILNENRINYLESIGFNRSQATAYALEENKMDLPIYYLEQMRKSILRWEKRNQKFVFENIEEFIHSESERMFAELELKELGVTEENIRKYIMFLSESTMNQMNQMKKLREMYGYFGGDFRLVPPRFREIESGVLLEFLHEKYPKGNTAVVYAGCRKCRNKDPSEPPCQSPRGAKCRVGGGKLRRGRKCIKKTIKKKQIRNRCKKKGKTFKK